MPPSGHSAPSAVPCPYRPRPRMTIVQPSPLAARTLTTHRPATPTQLGELVRAAVAAGHAVSPLGGQTQLDLGPPPERDGVGLDLTALAQVIDYPAGDMTVTVQAGIRIADLQRTLAAQ